jgi:hypothetical protein
MSLCGNSARIVLLVGVDLPLDEAKEARLDADVEIVAGESVLHERVREWIWKLIKGERIPPPEAWPVQSSGHQRLRGKSACRR